jgi:hypothetical protein
MVKGKPWKSKDNNPTEGKTPRRMHDPASFDQEYFTWRINDQYIDYDHDILGWDKVSILEFLKKIAQPLQSYEGLLWREIKCKDHCHEWVMDELPEHFYKRLQERQLFIDELFQISLGSKPRLLGYRKGRLFYLIWYDPDHQFWPTKAK